jgi:deoxycytidine triphosphate deaminase
MILSFQEIDAAIRAGQIVIDPRPDEGAWTSTAIDLTLNNVLLEWIPPVAPPTGGRVPWPRPQARNFNVQAMMDDGRRARRVEIDADRGYELNPRSFVLGFTREIVQLPVQSRIAARVEGKSSLARVGPRRPVTGGARACIMCGCPPGPRISLSSRRLPHARTASLAATACVYPDHGLFQRSPGPGADRPADTRIRPATHHVPVVAEPPGTARPLQPRG